MRHTFHHIHIKSEAPRETAKWWADMFQARILPEFHLEGEAFFCPIKISGVKINIATTRQHESGKVSDGYAGARFGLEHIGITTDDIQRDIMRLKEQGLQVFEIGEAQDLIFAYVEAPDDVRVELIQIGSTNGHIRHNG